jgi:hypothetical protein
MLPFGLSYDVKPDFIYFNYIGMTFSVRCPDLLNCGKTDQMKIDRF